MEYFLLRAIRPMHPTRWPPGCLLGLGLAGGLAAAGLAVMIYLIWLWKTPPPHWQQRQRWRQQTPLEERQALAIELEKRILRHLFPNTSVPPVGTGPRSAASFPHSSPLPPPSRTTIGAEEKVEEITLRVEEINAWLETRLPEFLANQNISVPQGVSDPMIAIEDDQLLLAFRYTSPKLSQVFTLRLRPEMVFSPPERKATTSLVGPLLRLQLERLEGGQLPLPTELVQEAMRRTDSPRATQAILAILNGQTIEPVAPLPGERRRQLRLLDCSLSPEAIRLKIKLESRARGQ